MLVSASRSPSSVPPAAPARLVAVGPWLGEAESRLLAARGLLWPVLPGIFATGRPTAALRAAALASCLRPATIEQGVVQDLGAAWVLGCAGRPERFDCTVGRRRGQALDERESRVLHQTFRTHQPYDVVRAGPLRITSPVRTAADLALGPEGPLRDTALLTLLSAPELRCGPATVAAAVGALPYAIGRRSALERLERLRAVLEERMRVPPGTGEPEEHQPLRNQAAAGAGREPVIR